MNELKKNFMQWLRKILIVVITAVSTFGVTAVFANNYAPYRPTIEEAFGFEELQRVNPNVFGWLRLYGTNIDYPLVQDANGDNRRYEHTNARGEPAMSGAIFLDVRNSQMLNQFNHIIYGHDMSRNAMFGEIGTFEDEMIFNNHPYGNVYTNGQRYSIDFFAFLRVDAFDFGIYAPHMSDDGDRLEFLTRIRNEAVQYRDIGVDITDRIIILSTCTPTGTNARHILIGRLTDYVPGRDLAHNQASGFALLEANLLTFSLLVVVITISATTLIARIQARKEEEGLRAKPPRFKKMRATFFGETVLLLGKISLIMSAVALVFVFFLGVTQVSDSSMAPTVREGDIIFFNRITPNMNIGTNIIIREDGQTQVRRVIATEGDEVDITSEGLTINGRVQVEMEIFHETTQFVEGVAFPLIVPAGEIFVLGDNRRGARDSRIYGTIPSEYVLGNVISVIRRRNL